MNLFYFIDLGSFVASQCEHQYIYLNVLLETVKNMRYPPSTASNGAPTCKGHTDWHTSQVGKPNQTKQFGKLAADDMWEGSHY